MNEIFSNLKQLANFKGRERRARFWPYVGMVLVAVILISGIGMSVLMAGVFESAPPANGETHSDFLASMRWMFLMNALTLAAAVLLLAAAVSRRLHDSGIRGYWGLLPVPFMIVAATVMPQLFANVLGSGDVMPWFPVLFLNNALYMATIVTLIVLLCRPTAKGPNKYGDEPT
jgi:uncharacterized membrane protein YhaH (DUF805 family)